MRKPTVFVAVQYAILCIAYLAVYLAVLDGVIMKKLLLMFLLGTLVSAHPRMDALIDLSLTYNLDDKASHRVKVMEKGTNRIYIGVEINQMCSSMRMGTHIEAPITFDKTSDGSVDAIPMDRLWKLPGVWIDLSPDSYQDDYLITAEVLQRWEDRDGLVVPDGGILLIYTGYFSFEGKLSKDDDGSEIPLPQPRLTRDAGEWLANYSSRHGLENGLYAVGTDLNSLDNFDTNSNTSARMLLYKQPIYTVLNMNRLNWLPQTDFLVTVMPMKIHNGEAAPARVVAEPAPARVRTTPSPVTNHTTVAKPWSSESDHLYPNPKWDWGSPVMAGGTRIDSNSQSILAVALPLLLTLRMVVIP